MDVLDNILALGNIGLSLYGNRQARSRFRKNMNVYQEQILINQEIGAFNATIADMTGREQVSAIALETKRLISEQRASFANRGIEFAGSPVFVLGDTYSMGSKKAQEAYFNAQVQKTNAQYNALTAMKHAEIKMEEAKWGARQQNLQLAQNIPSYLETVGNIFNIGNPIKSVFDTVLGFFK